MSLDSGSVVIVHLGSPREQVFGLLLASTAAGLTLRGMALSSFDDWLRDYMSGEPGSTLGLSTTFYPMHRVEKAVLDEGASGLPSMDDRFRSATGRGLADYVDAEAAASPGSTS